jgi:hypothetical protein
MHAPLIRRKRFTVSRSELHAFACNRFTQDSTCEHVAYEHRKDVLLKVSALLPFFPTPHYLVHVKIDGLHICGVPRVLSLVIGSV